MYGDCSDAACDELATAYAELNAKPSFNGARATMPMVAMRVSHWKGPHIQPEALASSVQPTCDWKEPTMVSASDTNPAMPGRPSEAKKATVARAQ